MTALAARLDELCATQPFHTGWALLDVSSGQTAHRHGDRVVPAASTRKVAILMTALAAVHEGKLRLDQPVCVDERFRDLVYTGTLQHLSVGLTLTLQDALTLMIVWSDNLCTGHVVELVGLDAVQRLCASVGMTGTTHRHALIPALPRDHSVDDTNATTPNDQIRLLGLILDGAADDDAADRLGCSTELCQLAMHILCQQKYREGIPSLLPDRTVVAHKTGHGWRDLSEVGVVFAGDSPRYALAIYVDDIPAQTADGLPGSAAARQHISRLARTCWDALCVSPPARVPGT